MVPLLRRHPWRFGFGAAVAGVAALHLGGLDTAPPGLYNDEASVGYNAWAIAHGGVDEHGASWPLFFQAFGEYKGPVAIYMLAPLLRILPLTPYVVRLPAALSGIAIAVVAGLIALRITGSRPVAMLTLLTAAVEPWLVMEARTSLEANIQLVLAYVLAVWCVSRAGSRRAAWWYTGAGVALGAGLFAYTPARLFAAAVAVLIAVCFGGLFGLTRAEHRDRRALLVLPPVAVAYAILLAWASQHPGALTGRFTALSITADHASAGVVVERFVSNYLQYVGAPFLFTHGDANLRHNTGFGGMLLVVTLPVLLAGLVECLRRIREPMCLFALLGLLAGPVPAALTMEGTPHSLRAASMLPFLLLVMVHGWARIWPWLSHHRLWMGVAAAAVAVECGGYFLDLYVEYPGRALAWFDTGEGAAIARAHDLAAGHRVLVSSDLDVPYIQALFYLQPDPAAYAREGLSVLGIEVLSPDAMGQTGGGGDVLVLAAGDTPPPGAQLLFSESVDVGRHTAQVGAPDVSTVTLVNVFRR